MRSNCYFPHLPVFASIKNAIKDWSQLDKLKHIIFVCVQHELATTINQFESLISFGAKPSNIYLLGKYYSTCNDVANKLIGMGINRFQYSKSAVLGEFENTFRDDVKKLWQSVLDRLSTDRPSINGVIIIDDGGRCISSVPRELIERYPIFAVEQTTSGLVKLKDYNLNIPIIEVASSAAKLWIESPMIAGAAIREKLEKILSNHMPNCGVIGTGYVGQAVAEKILSLQCKVFGFDINKKNISNHPNYFQCNSKVEVIEKADYIFGCTGYDITNDFDLENIKDCKKFFSCSSEDKEFLALLKKAQKGFKYLKDPLCNIVYKTNSGKLIEIMRGGFPITFDGSCQPAPVDDIQITQGLLLCAALQALELLPDNASNNKSYKIKLNPVIQQFISTEWSKTRKNIDEQLSIVLNKFNDISWIKANSGGKDVLCENMDKYFSKKYF